MTSPILAPTLCVCVCVWERERESVCVSRSFAAWFHVVHLCLACFRVLVKGVLFSEALHKGTLGSLLFQLGAHDRWHAPFPNLVTQVFYFECLWMGSRLQWPLPMLSVSVYCDDCGSHSSCLLTVSIKVSDWSQPDELLLSIFQLTFDQNMFVAPSTTEILPIHLKINHL